MALKNAGTSGYLEKDGHRSIDIRQWFLHGDGSLTLNLNAEQFNRDQNRFRENQDRSIFRVTQNGCELNPGTRIVLDQGIRRGSEEVTNDPEPITISERKECQCRDGYPTRVVNINLAAYLFH